MLPSRCDKLYNIVFNNKFPTSTIVVARAAISLPLKIALNLVLDEDLKIQPKKLIKKGETSQRKKYCVLETSSGFRLFEIRKILSV